MVRLALSASVMIICAWPPERTFAEDKSQGNDRKKTNIVSELTYNSSDIKTKQTTSSTASNLQVSTIALELGGDYFLTPYLALTGSLQLTLYASTDAEMKGVEAGLRYYPWQAGSKSETTLGASVLETSPGLSYFIHGGYVGKDYQFSSTSLFFQGMEAGGGFDYHLSQVTFWRLNVDYQMLQNTSARSQNGFAVGVAYGYAL